MSFAKPQSFVIRGTLLFAGFFFVVPSLALAAFSGPLPLQNSIGLRAVVQVNNTPVKSPVTVSAGSDFSIVWESVGVGCVSNWSEGVLRATGVTTGSITASRAFVVTCFGPGVAQTVKLQVNVGTTDLSVSSFSAVGLKTSKKERALHCGTIYASGECKKWRETRNLYSHTRPI